MKERIESEYSVYSESAEVPGPSWGVEITSLDSRELLSELGDPLGDGRLADEFAKTFTEDWVSKDYWAGTLDERLLEGWNQFAEELKRRSRYVFLRPNEAKGYFGPDISPHEWLDRLFEVVAACDVFTSLPAGTELFRARKHDASEVLETEEKLGPPEPSVATSQRMSPAGIPFLYTATLPNVALAELRGIDSEVATVGEWRTKRPTVVLDLVDVRPVPSIFDTDSSAVRRGLVFLGRFADEVSKPIQRGASDVEHVPTQVVAEFFRHCCKTDDGASIDGIQYRSSVSSGGLNIAWFEASGPESPVSFSRQHGRFQVEKFESSWRPLAD